jgi:hypothetical protein
MDLPTPFTDWPPGIRNAIYETLFEIDSPIKLATTFGNFGRDRVTTVLHGHDSGVKLLATCKQVNRDALAKSRHTYCGVTFSGDVSHVRFEYLPEYGRWDNDFLASVDYDLSETGQLVGVPSLVHPSTLMEVWKCCHTRDNILSRLPSSKGSITFDLDKHTASQALPPAFSVHHAFRKRILALRPPDLSWSFTALSCYGNVECKAHMQSQ